MTHAARWWTVLVALSVGCGGEIADPNSTGTDDVRRHDASRPHSDGANLVDANDAASTSPDASDASAVDAAPHDAPSTVDAAVDARVDAAIDAPADTRLDAAVDAPLDTSTPPPDAPACTRVPTIDSTGATNVTSALQSFIDASPSGSVICLVAGGQYRVDGQLHLLNRSNLTIDGRGARIFSAVRGTSPILMVDGGGNDLAFRNFTIQGANPRPGIWEYAYEHNHGIQLGGTIRVDIDHVTILNVGGDGVYLTAGTVGGVRRWADTIHMHNSIIDGNGRMGLAITDGASHVVFDFNTFRRIAYYTFDIEPNGYVWDGVAAGAQHVRLSDNTFGPQPFSTEAAGQADGHIFVVTGTSGGGPADDIEVSRNTVIGRPIDVGVYNNGGVRHDIRVVNNHSDTSAAGPVMSFNGVNTLVVTGNVQPLTSGQLASISGCTNVTYP